MACPVLVNSIRDARSNAYTKSPGARWRGAFYHSAETRVNRASYSHVHPSTINLLRLNKKHHDRRVERPAVL